MSNQTRLSVEVFWIIHIPTRTLELIISTFSKYNFWQLNFIILENDASSIEMSNCVYSKNFISFFYFKKNLFLKNQTYELTMFNEGNA